MFFRRHFCRILMIALIVLQASPCFAWYDNRPAGPPVGGKPGALGQSTSLLWIIIRIFGWGFGLSTISWDILVSRMGFEPALAEGAKSAEPLHDTYVVDPTQGGVFML